MEIKARIQGSDICFFITIDKALFGFFYAINRQSTEKFFQKNGKKRFFLSTFQRFASALFKAAMSRRGCPCVSRTARMIEREFS